MYGDNGKGYITVECGTCLVRLPIVQVDMTPAPDEVFDEEKSELAKYSKMGKKGGSVRHNVAQYASKLTAYRKERNLTQKELSRELGTTRESISAWERGVCGVPQDVVEIIERGENETQD